MKEQQEVKRLYKVLTRCEDGTLKGPYQTDFYYEIGREYYCENFNPNPNRDCSYGFYAVSLEGLLYCLNRYDNNVVAEVEVWGREVVIDRFKQRYENIKILKILTKQQVEQRIKREWQGDYNLFKALYPFHPFKDKNRKCVTKKDIKNLKLWSSVKYPMKHEDFREETSTRDSMKDSIESFMECYNVVNFIINSVSDSLGYGIRNTIIDFLIDSRTVSIGFSIRYSVWDSVYAYISSLFPRVKKWKYIEHEEGTNPFQPAIDLWLSGLVPSFDGEIWRLHGGNEGKVLYKISKNELKI